MGFYVSAKAFFQFYLIMFLMNNVAVSFAYMGSVMSDNIKVVAELAPGLNMPLICFGGFATPISAIPKYIAWLKYFSWYAYSTEAFFIIQWQDINLSCKIQDRVLEYDQCPEQLKLTGIQVIKDWGYDPDNLGTDIWAMILQMIVYRALGLIIMSLKFYFQTSERGTWNSIFNRLSCSCMNIFNSSRSVADSNFDQSTDTIIKEKDEFRMNGHEV